jgi:predicted CoA-binding protein
MNRKTVVIGASTNPSRYSHTAVLKLVEKGHDTVALGLREGLIGNTPIFQGTPDIPDVDTISLYVGADHQPPIYDYLLGLSPKRIIFNPGTENAELAQLAAQKGIEVIFGCNLVMLSIGTF